MDPDLLQYDEVWAAAGTWNDVFGIEPHKLVEASGGAHPPEAGIARQISQLLSMMESAVEIV
ncbi:MAG: hypothetical protein ACO3K6_03535, partial [Ilumatobacteraceae bacterium]